MSASRAACVSVQPGVNTSKETYEMFQPNENYIFADRGSFASTLLAVLQLKIISRSPFRLLMNTRTEFKKSENYSKN